MIVGTTNIDYETVYLYTSAPEGLVDYAKNLVPLWARHIPGIVDNQRYLVALHVRKMLTIQFYTRKSMTDALIKDIKITGIINQFISIYDILECCDTKKLLEMLEREHNG